MESRDIIKGLLVHINQEIDCEICPYQDVINCNEKLIKDAVNLIESVVRPRGEWISDNRTSKCSVCNFTTVIDTYNYCPNCGAEMGGNKKWLI